MKTIRNIDINEKVGQEVELFGWVNTRRDMGKIAFLDLRDRSALVQVVLVPAELDDASQEIMKQIRPEFVLKITGIVQERGTKQQNKYMPTGMVEVLAKQIEIINESETPPFEIDNETLQANEELRIRYRYLDLRHERMKNNMLLRHNIIKYIREYFYDKDFIEIETPFISKSTPEGARDFLVPSRNWPGKFYALPQSPQLFKQILMCSGYDRYMQVARCFRDEDLRVDRQPDARAGAQGRGPVGADRKGHERPPFRLSSGPREGAAQHGGGAHAREPRDREDAGRLRLRAARVARS